jgi:hypothetical protein
MKDYSKIFDHYYGLQYDNNVNAVIKVHELMEKAGIEVSSTTKEKLDSYSDKRPFKVHYFISKQGKKLKWCPTASEDKLLKMSLKPAEWWIAQLDDHVVSTPVVNIPNNWLDEQAIHILNVQISATASSALFHSTGILTESSTVYVNDELELKIAEDSLPEEEDYDYLPF